MKIEQLSWEKCCVLVEVEDVFQYSTQIIQYQSEKVFKKTFSQEIINHSLICRECTVLLKITLNTRSSWYQLKIVFISFVIFIQTDLKIYGKHDRISEK